MASMIRSDLEFVLQQILIAEAHAAGADLSTLVPNTFVPFGLRTVDGTYNNLLPGQTEFGASDNPFLRLVEAVYRNDADGDTFPGVTNTDYGATGNVADADPRVISNLIADMTTDNPAAVAAFVNAGLGTFVDGVLHYLDGDVVGAVVPPSTLLQIPNTAPDAGLSAPFNSWFTFFGQFFDHGLDLVNKSSTETIFIPLQPDDPLFNPSSPGTNFMALSRTVTDANGDQTNQTTPFVDQNQTYTSHASHQVFLREYVMTPGPNGHPIATGKLLDGADGGLTTWADVKAQALMLGIRLNDYDVLNVPELRTDAYGKFIPDANGFAQVIVGAGADGIVNTADDLVASGTASSPIDTLLVNALRTGHAFLNDIAHDANPVNSQDGHLMAADGDSALGLSAPGTYDDELLARHFITGDGRGNENIALTAVHHVFHSEHNRQVDEIKATILATNDSAFISQWLLPGSNQADGVQALEWNGERLFQSARFATEMQYQHLVFEEFARKMSPNIDEFLADTNYATDINPAIVAEFAHAVFRVGHTMLTESVDRLDPNFVANDVSLLNAFLNPLEFNENGTLAPKVAAGAIVRGMTRQEGNEIDEFVTDAVRNSLLGLPLDLAAINIARGRDTGIPTLNAARREFFEMTADQQLKPYSSWVDLTQHLKHEESVVNFIAAYGTHSALTATDVDTVDEKRAVAAALVLGGSAVINAGGVGGTERIFVADNNDRHDFLNSTGAYVNTAAGVTTTGVDAIDLWIGGLAEEQMPFGGLLGSTFNFVFETQLENLQNGDRLYYLSRLAGLNFLTEMENNTFAKLVMANTDATHLPADIFSAPGFILEVDPTRQFTGLGADNRADPTEGGSALVPLVIRDNPDTAGPDTNYLRYTGDDHVVLGGTAGNDVMVANIGDDTIYGDGGNDRIEGGDGNDQIEGGDGDDIITDRGGDDVLKGNDGNDVIHGGNGFNTIVGGNGSDFIITGEDVSTVFAGQGNDFVLGAKSNLPTFGNEGHDWIELGTQDGTTGDSFDPLNQDNVIGNDVLISGGGFDELIGEGGDDIFTGSDGEDHFDGGSGFDWASYKFDKYGVTANMVVNDFIELGITPSTAGILDRFAFTEGLSGSAFSDFLRGDNEDATLIAQAGFHGSVLTNIDLITGLRDILPEGTTSFGAGNIILGGDGADLIEGRGGNDIIDGDAWLNVRIAVSNHVPRVAGATPITSVDSMKELVPYMLSGEINPSQLSIVREILHSDSADFDTAVFSGPRGNYTVTTGTDGVTTVTDNVGTDGTDTLRNIERLQFGDVAVVLSGTNNAPTGTLALSDTTPQVNQLISVSAFGFTPNSTADDVIDADNVSASNPSGNLAGRAVAYIWQWEPVPGSGIFEDVDGEVGDLPATQEGTSFRIRPDLEGFSLRVRAVYEDANGVMENVFSAATAPVAAGAPLTPPVDPPEETLVSSPGVRFIRSDLQFILEQIQISERHAAGEDLHDILPNSRVAFGLRTVDGSFNNLVQGQTEFGAADNLFPRLLDPAYRNDLDGDSIALGPGDPLTNTNYAGSGNVVDADPRTISNLIVDQTDHNPATAGLGTSITSPGLDGRFGTADDTQVNFIPNTAADEGLSAPFNAFMTFFGQFFDHGLDLVTKGGNGTIFVPLQPDDPLYVPGGNANFLVLTRATQFAGPGADGILVDNPATAVNEAADNTIEAQNTTTPFVDQNQTYTSHPSHQVFLRAYELDGQGHPVSTGKLITNRDLGLDGKFGTADDTEIGGMATWGVVKAQARDLLGIALTDLDVLNLPLLRTDAYGKFIPAANGFAQVITGAGADGIFNTADDVVVAGNPAAPIDTLAIGAVRTGHAFLNDIAHAASPVNDRGQVLTADTNSTVGGTVGGADATHYDNELLDAHYIAGDGRANENIGLTTVHHVFHSEHNRLVELTREVALASNDVDFLNQWLLSPVAALPTDQAGINALNWNGERLFQAARFGTEMQYQHLVFEEFARKVQPQVDIFFAATQVYDTEIDPSIVAEFAHTVYRFGHSMLTETVDRFDANFNVVGDPNSADPDQQLGLIAAFLNPLEFAASGPTPEEAAGAITRGLTRQPGNQIDEFVTEALRNNLLGLPLDLATINLLRGRDTGVPSLNAARRDFYDVTGDSQLKPYSSWVDLLPHLKHQASLINFIAAYGTHASILAANSVADKRLAATNLVLGVSDPSLTPEEVAAFNADRLAFLNSTGAYANSSTGVTTTGVDDIDFWIGGLAEKNMPFGGMLGTTFNFVFEEQMEKLQDGDRFYYLERTQGLNFLTELENNSFARLVMANTDATHLPMDVFSTPAFTLEVDPTKQLTGLGPDGRDDPAGVVLRSNPDDPSDPNYLHYTGEDHVVLGGSNLTNDTLIASVGDDTVYGDAGNDRLEGGDGNDFVIGGDGDDIMTDVGGDDNMQGGDGNDAIHGGNGLNLILGGFGSDFIVTGEDASEAFGGPGNDFILGARANEFVFGNEGDDWIEWGMADGSAGENFDAFNRDLATGNDVFIGNTISDRMDGEGGDDIMVGNGGNLDRYEGFSGFDWAVFKDDQFGVTADFELRAFDETPVPLSNATVLARFVSMEGLSGSQFADVLRGDAFEADAIALSGARGSVLTNIGLIDGLQDLLNRALDTNVTSFGAGNIILGGGGSDIIEGRGGDDIIDGDAWLDVWMKAPDGLGGFVRADNMTELMGRVFAGDLNPGDISIVREIHAGSSTDFDTAVFTDIAANYDFTETNAAGDVIVRHLVAGGDGTDVLRNIERLQFADQAFILNGSDDPPTGFLTISDTTPTEDQVLTASALLVTDADNISATNPTGAISPNAIAYFWQVEVSPGIFEDILIENVGGEVARASGPTFTPRGFEVGSALRVRAVYKDDLGVLENVFSEPTAPVESNNALPVGVLRISDITPTETFAVQAIIEFTDADGLPTDPAAFHFQWQQSTTPGGGAVFANIAGATAASFTPGQDQVNRQLRVVVTYTDLQGHPEIVTSAPTVVTGDSIIGTNAAEIFNGNAGQDVIIGNGGNDIISGNAEDDLLDGGAGADTLNGGTGDDTLLGGAGGDTLNGDAGNDAITGGDGGDTVSGGAGDDRFIATAGDGNDSYNGNAGTDTYDLSGILVAGGVTVTATSANGGGTGTDTLNNIENVIGSQGNDSITLDAGVNVVDGQAGNDTISTGAAADIVNGGAGNDTINGGAGADTLNGNEGDDTFTYNIGDGNDTIDGGDGSDRVNILGAAGAQTLAVLLAGTAISTFAGASASNVESFTANLGAGNDLLNYGATTTAVAVDLVAGTATGFTSISNIEDVTGGSGNDTLFAGAGANVLTGGAGDDTLTGGAGGDTLAGGAGNDTFRATLNDGNDSYAGGGGNDDTYDVSAITVAVNVNLAAGTSSSAQTGTDTLATIEHVVGGSAGDVLTGSNGANTLEGGGGGDTINGGGGADLIDGGAGNDALNGEAGQDIITGGLGNDTVNGGAAADTFVATQGDGNDSYTGGAGNDTYTLAGTSSGATITTNAAGNGTATSAATGSDTLVAVENFIGSQGNDVINVDVGANVVDGQDGDDIINTGAGADRLTGGLGNDSMNGGAGNDVFLFGTGFGLDTITGFAANAQDRMDLQALGITALDFVDRVDILDQGANTLVTIDDVNTITLLGVTGDGTNVITQADFILTP
ncbi:peroxidase family protein [Variovorax saccharolyticus]|uniref:peroxidase family protein n=1 Tax=Variovorax saccharolyticus TaxID=3053516 RepID=UPI0025771811|nr:peroxidase family protein [Variovorax sp. J22R187]MDM0018336.1 peroxidase family protein [Variovorax sp. J22R187]